MPRYVDPRRFIDKPMILKSVAAGEASVMIDGVRAGRILQQHRSGPRVIFVWTLTSPFMAVAGVVTSGERDTLGEAKTAIREAFQVWLKWALEQEKPVVWYG